MTNRRILLITANIVAVAVIAAAILLAANSGATITPFQMEEAEMQLGLRARAFQQMQVHSEDEAEVLRTSNIKYEPDKQWDGEIPFGPRNDWEPAIAADPNEPYVYALTTRFGRRTNACRGCPNPHIMLRRSNDNGDTWKPVQYLCRCKSGSWQYDPIIEVDDNGTVHALILDSWETLYTRSEDHGKTWTKPESVENYNNWTDHGFLTISPDGQDLYVGFSQARSWIVASHDGGDTWETPIRTNTPGMNQYFYHYYGTVLPDDTALMALAAVPSTPYSRGPIQYYAARSTDMGATWDQVLIDEVQQQPPCDTIGCRNDHFAGLSAMASDPDGDIVYAYAGAKVPTKGQLMFVKSSTDGGQTWSPRVEISPEFDGTRRIIAAFPAVISKGDDHFGVVWMDNSKAFDRWNTWYSESTDGGMTWSEPVDISDAQNGAPYKHPAGFDGDYGDYLDADVLSDGRAIAISGQAFGYYGPGNTWINREQEV